MHNDDRHTGIVELVLSACEITEDVQEISDLVDLWLAGAHARTDLVPA